MNMPARLSSHRSIVVACVLAVTIGAGALAQGPRQDGQWEVKIEMELPGVPALPPQTQTTCVTPEDAANPQKLMVPGGIADQAGCKISDYKTVGNKVTYALKCEGLVALSGTGDFTYMGDTYTGSFKADMAGQKLTIKYSAKRTGDCKS